MIASMLLHPGQRDATCFSTYRSLPLPLPSSKAMPWIPTKKGRKHIARVCDISDSPASSWILTPKTTERSQTIDGVWQAAMTRRPTAFRIRLREVAEGNEPSASAERKSGRAAIPRFTAAALAVSDKWTKHRHVSFYSTITIEAFTKTGRTHSHALQPLFVSRHPFFLNASLL